MKSSARALQDAVIAWLKADGDVKTFVGDRVFDEKPDNTTAYPFISMGSAQVLPDKGDDADGAEVTFDVDAWSQNKKGRGEVLNVAGAVAAALDDATDIVLKDGLRLVDLVVESIRDLRDPDGVTRHAIITCKALTEPI